MTRPLAEPPSRLVARGTAQGGFVLEGEDGTAVSAAPDEDGWTVEAGARRWRVRREEPAQHVLLEEAGGGGLRELCRMTPWHGAAGASVPAALLLEDGRLFLIGPRAEQGFSVGLSGWETPGPYWVAWPTGAQWTLEATPAGREARIGWDALVLLAVALLPLPDEG